MGGGRRHIYTVRQKEEGKDFMAKPIVSISIRYKLGEMNHARRSGLADQPDLEAVDEPVGK